MAQEKAHLGVGWAFPVKPVGGRLRFARYEDDIEQAIEIILLTVRGERPMRSDFGTDARTTLFEPNSPATRRALAANVKRALIQWEARIDVERVEAVASDERPDLLLVHIDYVVRATNSRFNRVYPYYLLEGGV
jgi:phage baseplate assembly protein W